MQVEHFWTFFSFLYGAPHRSQMQYIALHIPFKQTHSLLELLDNTYPFKFLETSVQISLVDSYGRCKSKEGLGIEDLFNFHKH